MRPLWSDQGLSLSGWGHYFPRCAEQQPPESLPEPTKAEKAVLGDVLGVLSRHVADADESVNMMAVEAVRMALRKADVDPTAIDLVIVSTSTDRENVPDNAPRVARSIGAHQALAFNLGGACIGFVHGVHTAASFLVAQGLRCAVVVAADRFTTRFGSSGWGNRMAGDGAGAVVIQAGRMNQGVLRDSVMLSFGEHADLVTTSAKTGAVRSLPKIATVAAETAAQAVNVLLERNNLKLSEVDWVVTHAGSQRVLDSVRRRLDTDPERVITNYAHRGSTAAATVPSSVSESIESGLLQPGQLIITPCMGAGWFTGALLFSL